MKKKSLLHNITFCQTCSDGLPMTVGDAELTGVVLVLIDCEVPLTNGDVELTSVVVVLIKGEVQLSVMLE